MTDSASASRTRKVKKTVDVPTLPDCVHEWEPYELKSGTYNAVYMPTHRCKKCGMKGQETIMIIPLDNRVEIRHGR